MQKPYDFSGEYTHQVDSKKRISIPAAMREQLCNKPLVLFKTMVGLNHVNIYPKSVYEEIVEEAAVDLYCTDEDLSKKTFGKLDSAGRISLGEDIHRHLGIPSACVVKGMGDHIELWDTMVNEQYLDFKRHLEVLKEKLLLYRQLQLDTKPVVAEIEAQYETLILIRKRGI